MNTGKPDSQPTTSRVAWSIILPAVFTLAFFAAALWFIYLPALENTAMERKREMIRELNAAAMSVIADHHLLARTGRLTEDRAKEGALRHLRVMRYGPNNGNYFWVNDVGGRMLMHPYRIELEGQDVRSVTDPDGKPLFREFIAMARDGGGFVPYKWQWFDQSETITPKLSYVALFEPWGWIVGTGVYVQDVKDQVADAKRNVFLVSLAGMLLVSLFCAYLVRLALASQRRLQALAREREEFALACSASERNMRVILDSLHDAVFIHTPGGRIKDVNRKTLELFGVSRDQALSLSLIKDYSAPDALEATLQAFWLKALSGDTVVFDWPARRPGDGFLFDAEVVMTKIVIDGQNMVLALMRDITSRKNAEQRLKLFEQVFENALEGISITDDQGRIVAVNPAFTDITGYEAREVMGQNPRVLKSDRHETDFYRAMWNDITHQGHWSGEIWNRRKSGEAYPEWLAISAIKDNYGQTTHYVAVFHDITEMKRKEDLIRHQAYHDALTDLPNRLLLQDRLKVAISHAKRYNKMIGVVFVDLDNFKNINDSLGHPVGDRLLQMAAQRFKPLVRESDTVSRLGGDEFVIMVEDIESERDAVHLAERILDEVDTPFIIDGHELFLTTSIGITIYPEDGGDPETLIKNADTAMYRAKYHGKNTYRLFTQEMNERIVRRLSLESSLRKALDTDQFFIEYQPRIGLRERDVTGMEALVRWRRSSGDRVPPDEFIPLAEETGIIIPLGEMILKKACLQAKAFMDAGRPDLKVSVNLSTRQFEQADLAQRVRRIMDETGLPAENLELEITETAVMTDIERSVRILDELTALGVTMSIDDFGTGYSSLFYLKRFPIGVLKIDRSFIADVTVDPGDANLVSTIMLMARHFTMRTVAEGVEERGQLNFLLNAGCDEIQGYYFSRPLPPDKFAEFLENRDWEEKMS